MLHYDKRALRRLMVARGLDDARLSKQAGLTRQTISYLARGVTEPKASTLAKIANVLEVEVGVFFRRAA